MTFQVEVEAIWGRLRAILGHLGPLYGHLLGPLEALLEALGVILGRFGRLLGQSSGHLGRVNAPIAGMYENSTTPTRNCNFGGHDGAKLAPSWAKFGPSGPKLDFFVELKVTS